MNRVDRLLGYLITFQGKKLVRAQDLAERFDVSERTVYRDIDALCELGVPIVGVAGEGYRLMDGYYLPPIMFSEEEVRGLFLSVSLLTSFTPEGTTRDAAQSAIEKIQAVLPEATLRQVEVLRTVIGFYAFGRAPLNLDDPKFGLLQQAIQKRRVVRLHYHAMHTNRITERLVEPLHLAYLESTWVLSGYCRLRNDERNFRLDRIDELQPTGETFAARPNVFPHSEAGNAVDVVVRFQPEVVRWVRESQHFSFRMERPPHGDDSVSMVYEVRSRDQILRWLIQWGTMFEILEPAEFRTEVTRIAVEMAARHSGELAI